MPAYDDGIRDCLIAPTASATITWEILQGASDCDCQIAPTAGQAVGEQVTATCSASPEASAGFGGVTGPAATTPTVDATITIAFDDSITECQVSPTADADQHQADPSQERWELFHSTTPGVFDFDSPVDTWTSPGTRELSAATYGDGTHYFVLRKRNKWGLSSQNIRQTKIVISSGKAIVPPPSMPLEVTIAQVGDTMRVRAAYYAHQDGDAAANQWLAYVTTDGSDPTLATPTVTNMTRGERGVRRFSYDTEILTGNTVRAVLKTRRRDNDGTMHDSSFSSEVTKVHGLFALDAPGKVGVGSFNPTE